MTDMSDATDTDGINGSETFQPATSDQIEMVVRKLLDVLAIEGSDGAERIFNLLDE